MEPLIDQCSGGVLHGEPGLGVFETHLAGAGGALFDSRLGLAVRRWCPPLLGLDAHCPAVHYLARRRELGAFAATRLLLRGSGIGAFVLDTGDAAGAHREDRGCRDDRDDRNDRDDGERPAGAAPPGEPVAPAELASAAGRPVHEAVRLPALLERAAGVPDSVGFFLARLAEAVRGAARSAVAFVLSRPWTEELGDGSPPGPRELRRAAAGWLRRGAARGSDPVLARHLLWTALAARRPVQLHCRDPRPLGPLLRATAGQPTPLVLLPGSSHHRCAARLAGVFPQVYADVGRFPAEALEQAPFGKLLFGSRARNLPELHVVAAGLFRQRLRRLLDGWVADGDCTRPDTDRIASLVAGGTARRVYGI